MEFDLDKEAELMNSMQSSMASALWASIGATDGLDLPEEETPGEGRLSKRRALATFPPRCLRYTADDTIDIFRSLNPQLWPSHLFPETLLLEFRFMDFEFWLKPAGL